MGSYKSAVNDKASNPTGTRRRTIPQEESERDIGARDLKSASMIDATFRNGSVTAIGIVTGFSLTFFVAWVNNPLPWEPVDAVAIVPLIIGVGLLVWSLASMLSPRSLELDFYLAARNRFLIGLVILAVGMACAIIIDLLRLGNP